MARHASGKLEVVHGSMFGGKTEWMIARLRAEETRGRTVRAFKHVSDNRYAADFLVTHREDRFPAIRVAEADDILRQVEGIQVVAIDEGHFFTSALLAVVEELLARGLTVIVAGITHDMWGRRFAPIPQLADMADEITLRQAPCRICGAPAPFNQRMTPIVGGNMIGGLPDYEPRCAAHFEPLPAASDQKEPE